MDKKIPLRINSLLKFIDEVLNDTKEIELKDLEETSILLRATCFSITQIGEQMNKLEKLLTDRYPDLPLRSAKRTRNFLVHEYERIDVEIVYTIIKEDLPALKQSLEKIKKDFE